MMSEDSIFQPILNGYYAIWELRDRRVEGWFLMSSPLPTLIICLSYVMIVSSWGPNYMKNRPPFRLQKVIIFYNFFQVLFNIWLFYEQMIVVRVAFISFRCQPIDYSDDPIAISIACCCWWYFIAKFTEFFDTFFFVLRKKSNQISVLHVVHHGIMPMCWFGVRFSPGGHGALFGIINTFVHIIMYFYYMLSVMGPRYAKITKWKKYLTAIQMVQFVVVFIHSSQLFFIECNFPIVFAWIICGGAVVFLLFFVNFFLKTYNDKNKNQSRVVDCYGKSGIFYKESKHKIHNE